MTRIRSILAILLATTLTVPASAQFFPPPIVQGVPVLVPNGIDFQYKGRRLSVNGFFGNGTYSPGILPLTGGLPMTPGQPFYLYTPGYFPQYYSPYGYPYGTQSSSVTLQIINPPAIGNVRRGLADDFDINGIDLDLEPAAKIWNRNAPAVGNPRVAAQRDNGERQPDNVRVPAVAAPKPEPPAVKPPAVVPPKPALPIDPEWKRLTGLGAQSFEAGEYGIAMLRFRQAAGDSPRAVFLQAQACMAVGRYPEAVELIHQGLKRQPDWARSGYRPKAELYGNDAARWRQHLTRLEQTQRERPLNADYLFLLGYVAWFDGDRAAAIGYFQRSRTLADDPRSADLFLKAAQ